VGRWPQRVSSLGQQRRSWIATSAAVHEAQRGAGRDAYATLASRAMERHLLGSQAFVPLSKQPYLIVVAPRGEFVAQALHAFLAKPGQGVNYARGVWHHALIALNEVSEFIVIDRGGPGPDCDEVQLAQPVTIFEDDLTAAGLRTLAHNLLRA
jgi:ureidoglycolate hydrolase